MPGIVQVQVSRARNLPIMDKSSELTDAFAEVRLFVHLSPWHCMQVTQTNEIQIFYLLVGKICRFNISYRGVSKVAQPSMAGPVVHI